MQTLEELLKELENDLYLVAELNMDNDDGIKGYYREMENVTDEEDLAKLAATVRELSIFTTDLDF